MKSFLTSTTASFAARFASKSVPAQPHAVGASTLDQVRRAALGVLLLGSVFLASPVAAQQYPVVVDKTDVATFRVRTQNPLKQHVKIQVLSGVTGQQLFAETYDQLYYSRRLNFQNLQPGAYFLTTKLGRDTYRYTIQVKQTRTGQAVAVRNVKVRLSNASRQLEALNTLVPAATPAVAAK